MAHINLSICHIEVQGVPWRSPAFISPDPLPPPRAPEHTVRRAFRQAAAEATRNYSTGFGPCGRHGVLGPTKPHSDRCARLRETHIYSSHP